MENTVVEYVSDGSRSIKGVLDVHNEDGWSLVAAYAVGNYHYLYFERPLP